MSEYRIYVGEQGLRAENAQLKAEIARLRADNARLRNVVGEPQLAVAAPLMTDAYVGATSSNARIGTLAAVSQARPAVINVDMAPNQQAQAGQVQAGQVSGEGTEGAKFTIGPAAAGVPQLNPAIAAARARGPVRPGQPPMQPPMQPIDIPMPSPTLKSAEVAVEEDEAVQRFAQMEMK